MLYINTNTETYHSYQILIFYYPILYNRLNHFHSHSIVSWTTLDVCEAYLFVVPSNVKTVLHGNPNVDMLFEDQHYSTCSSENMF